MRDDLTPTGNCYEAAGEYLREQAMLGRTDIVLVHGRPTLQRKHQDKPLTQNMGDLLRAAGVTKTGG